MIRDLRNYMAMLTFNIISYITPSLQFCGDGVVDTLTEECDLDLNLSTELKVG